MKAAIFLVLAGLLMPAVASAHPHMWISQSVRVHQLSAVSGEVASRDPGPSASAIPWLLLKAKTNSGSGVFSSITHVQRLQTVGGIAPTEACSAANLKHLTELTQKYLAEPDTQASLDDLCAQLTA